MALQNLTRATARQVVAKSGETFQQYLDRVDPLRTIPLVHASTGQSNSNGAYSGGANPANENVFVFDSRTNTWGSSQYDKAPMSEPEPVGNGGNNNISLAFCHRLQEETGRKVYLVHYAIGGRSIDNWVGVDSTIYHPFAAKVVAALATPELANVTRVNTIHFQQGEEDNQMLGSTYLSKYSTVMEQFRAEPWFAEDGIILNGESSELHDRYPPKEAQKKYCTTINRNNKWVSSAGLPTGDPSNPTDPTHFTAQSLFLFGYSRLYDVYTSGQSDAIYTSPLFYGRGAGFADVEDLVAIAGFSTLLNWNSKISTGYPVNGVAATGSIGWGDNCQPDGNYTQCFGKDVSTTNICNYTMLAGRDIIANDEADYSAGFGYRIRLNARATFATGEGHELYDEGSTAVGSYSKYDSANPANPVKFQVGTGTSNSNRENALTVFEDNTVEIKAPRSAQDPTDNEDIVFKQIDNTTLRILMKSGGVVRSVDLTLA